MPNCLALSGGASVALLIKGAAEPLSFVWALRILERRYLTTAHLTQYKEQWE